MYKMINKTIVIITILLSVAFANQADSSKKISCGLLIKYPYTSYSDNNGPDGFCVEIVELAAKRAGLSVDFIPGTNDQLLKKLVLGDIDCIPFMDDSLANDEVFKLAALNLLTIWGKVVTAKNVNELSIDDLKGRRVGFLVDDICSKSYLNFVSNNRKIIPVWYLSYNALQSDLDSYKIVAGVISDYYITTLLRSSLVARNIQIPVVRITLGYRIGLADDIRIRLSKEIDKMMQGPNSEYYEILEKYGQGYEGSKSVVFYNQFGFAKLAYYIFSVLAIAIIWLIVVLHRKNKSKKQAEKNFAHEYNTLYYFYKNLNVPLLVHNVSPQKSGYILLANRAANELFGEDVSHVSFDDVFVMPDSDDSIEAYIEKLELDTPTSFNVRLKDDVEYKNKYEFNTQIMPAGDRAFTFIDNYTDEIQMLSNLQDSQYELEMATEAGKVGVFEYNIDSRIITGNNQLFVNLGLEYRESGIYYGDFLKLVRFEDANSARSNLENLIAGNITSFTADFEVINKDGQSVWLTFNTKAINRDKNGIAKDVVGVIIDIDHIKRLVLKLEGLSTNFELLMDNSPDIIYFKDIEYKFLWTSKSLAVDAGFTDRSEIIGKDDFFIHSKSNAIEFNKLEYEVIHNGKSFINYEQSYLASDGIKKWVLTTKVPVRNSEGNIVGLLGVGKDITKYKHILETLNSSQRIKSIGKLAGGIAHDFNNSLNGIMGFTHMLQEIFTPDSKEGEYLSYIMKGTERCADLTRHLLAFARQGKYLESVVDVHKLIITTVGIVEHTINSGVHITCALNAVNYRVQADSSQIENVLINLISNSEYAITGEGNIIIETSNIISEQIGEDLEDLNITLPQSLQIKVSDDGEGIAPENLDNIFDPFYTTKKIGEGSGLGLSAVYGIINNHNGTINVESDLGEGCCFTIILPINN